MREQEEARELLEAWCERFEGQGFSPRESERMARMAAGSGVVKQAHGGAVDLTEAFADHFEREGEMPEVALAMGAVASGEINPSPRLTGSEIVKIVEGREAPETVRRRGGEKPRRQDPSGRDAGGTREIDLTEHHGNMGCIVLGGEQGAK